MKNILSIVFVFVALATMPTYAQDTAGDMSVGGHLAFGLDTSNNTAIGAGAKYLYNITDPLRIEGSATYLVSTEGSGNSGLWDVNVNAHWMFPIGEKFYTYPLVGLGVLGSGNYTSFITNVGGGVDYKFSQSVFLNIEAKYMFAPAIEGGAFVLSAGIAFIF